MEIYTGSTEKVKVNVPFTATAVDIKAYDEAGTFLYEFGTVVKETDGYSVTLPFFLVDTDRHFTIRWHFEYVESGPRTYDLATNVSVVTPYANISEIRDVLGVSASLYTDAELLRAERRVRGVIDGFTGQNFGRFIGTRKVTGAGESQLKLPERLVSIESLGGAYVIPDPAYYAVRGGGYYIGTTAPLPDNGDLVFTSVIRSPDSMYHNNIFRENVVYTITGVWGWDAVPTSIKEAALLLIEDSLDPDSEYRERYGAIVRAADWTFEYHDKAYDGTGNATADRLLEPYKRWSMTVI